MERRAGGEVSVLRWFVAAVFLLFVTCALTLCLFFSASSSYESDFLPALMLLAVIGILGLERALAGLPVWRRIARWGWCLLLACSVAFNSLASIEAHATANYFAANSLLYQRRGDEAIDVSKRPWHLSRNPRLSASVWVMLFARKGGWMKQLFYFKKLWKSNRTSQKPNMILVAVFYRQGGGMKRLIISKRLWKSNRTSPEAHDPAENNNLAWSLATNPEASKRNGALAVKLAESACRRTHYQVTTMVGTLAAAYAEAGRFEDAISTAQKAITLARQSGESDLLQKNRELLALYLQHKPYHESQANPPK